jgi:tRNA(fMet)-specific endonuclease VapC
LLGKGINSSTGVCRATWSTWFGNWPSLQGIALGEIAVSTVTAAEMMYGMGKSRYQQKNKTALQAFLAPLEIVDFDFAAARQYGVVRAHLEKIGKPIGAYDLMISAHALSLGLVLVTNNKQEYQRIPDLIVENWVKR